MPLSLPIHLAFTNCSLLYTKGLLWNVDYINTEVDYRCVCFAGFPNDWHTDLERQFNINADDGKITLANTAGQRIGVWHNITITPIEIVGCLGLFISSLCACVQFMPCDQYEKWSCFF